jgi:NAD(P)-dependent dehydrogenase (short-subunit alcohol dehydrogenase family)
MRTTRKLLVSITRIGIVLDTLNHFKEIEGNLTMGKLEGKVAVVTGGGTGMGFATAKLLVEEGAYVYIIGRRQNKLDAAIEAIGHNITAMQGDISNLADLDRLYETVQLQHGSINILFANAGVGTLIPMDAVTEEQFDYEFGVNAKGTFFTVQKALPLLQDGSSIILNSSIAAAQAWPLASSYSGTKAAIRAFARAWSAELLGRRIRVNVISAGTIVTDIGKISEKEEENEQFLQHLVSKIPMKRAGTPDDIARSVLFLASDDSSFITGTNLFIDGGAVELGAGQI